MMGRLPSYGFFVRHTDRVRLRDDQCITDQPDARPAIVCDDADDVILDGLDLSAPVGGAPLIDLRNTRRAFLTGTRSPAGSQVFAQVSGPNSAGITLVGNSLESGQKAVNYIDGATESALKTG
jgi:hypothetical protein